MSLRTVSAAAVALAGSLISAQTFTACNPMKQTCKEDPALGGSVTIDFTAGENSFFNTSAGTTLAYDKSLGAAFTIKSASDAPTISSSKYLFYGTVDVTMQAAPGVGVVTSVVLQSDDLDEIDWEWLGGQATQVQTNYFSKGCIEVYDRGGFAAVTSATTTMHTYTIDWQKDLLQWKIDGTVVRELKASSASGCDAYPQTPMQVKLGIWDAGNHNEPQGTIDWAGGITDFTQAPFIAYYKEIKITDAQTGATSYLYGDMSGSSDSIQIRRKSSSSSVTSSTSPSSSLGANSSSSSSDNAIMRSSGFSTTAWTAVASATGSGSNTTLSSAAIPKTSDSAAGTSLANVSASVGVTGSAGKLGSSARSFVMGAALLAGSVVL